MHNCPPPKDALDTWLNDDGTVQGGNFGHLLLEQKSGTHEALVEALKPYFESAHRDAREHFHQFIGIDLHPDGTGPVNVSYPNSLPVIAQRGLFGEVMAGMITEAFQHEFVGSHEWKIPIFLFRYHADVEHYLWTLKNDPAQKREIFGRHGSDFIAIALKNNGELERVIVGEAKWRKSLTDSVVSQLLLGPKKKDKETGESQHNGRGIWFEMNKDTPIPHGLRQLQRLLEERDPDGHSVVIHSIDKAVLNEGPKPERTNLVLIAGNGSEKREPGDLLINWKKKPEEYTSPHDLQIVELIIEDGEGIINDLYATLFMEVGNGVE